MLMTSGGKPRRAAATFRIRPLRGRDLPQVLAIERQAFPEDPWTLDTAGGRLPRSPLGGQSARAVRLARFIRLIRLAEFVHLIRLTGLVALRRPAASNFIVAEAGRAIAGYACLSAAGGQGDIQAIAVRAEWEGHGIGRALLADLIATGTARGCREILLYVRADSPRPRMLYRRTGFTEVDVLRGYYQPSGADALVMCLPVIVSGGELAETGGSAPRPAPM
jgi:ribosomal protein S18 acetylase RimI-like enzyme